MVLLVGAPRLLLLGATLASVLGQTVGQLVIPVEECPLAPPCCEEDCCGPGTSWDTASEYCVTDEDSLGFNGTYSDVWEPGCVMRRCCGANCCDAGTSFDEEIACCVPIATGVPSVPSVPSPKEIGEDCDEDSECKEEYCFKVTPSVDGVCSCNPESGFGCSDGLVCATPEDAFYFVQPPPSCYLPFGASCTSDSENTCLSGICGEESGVCGCSTVTNNPCAEGERCVSTDGESVCEEETTVDPGDLGDPCFLDSDCKTETCVFGNTPPGVPGSCECNLDTEEGCEGDYECYTFGEVGAAKGEPVVSVSHICKLPVGAPCDPGQADDCLTGTCDQETGACACNLFTSFGCDEGKECVEISDGSFSCLVIGDGSDGAIGSDCSTADECDTDYCFFGNIPPGTPGTCTCNPVGNDGCEGDFICYDTGDLADIRGISDQSPTCYLPIDSLCGDDSTPASDCVTGNCDILSGTCGCNEFTNFGCNEGQQCVEIFADSSTTSFSCVEIGDGSIGSDCFVDDDCDFEICSFDPPSIGSPGFCTCNPELESGDGCEGDYECYTSGQIGEAVGALISVSNFCKLPVGAVCDPDENDCLTANCDATTGVCACNTVTNFGCNEGEQCVESIIDSSFSCEEIGDGSIGSTCVTADECDTNSCFFGFGSSVGTCTCNPDGNAGCEGDFVCYGSGEIADIQGIADSSPGCYLPIGAECIFNEPPNECVTGNCDIRSGTCGCNAFTNFGCSEGEQCVEIFADSSTTSFSCEEVGDGSIGSACAVDDDCDFQICSFDPPPFGFCTCNPELESGDGCEGDYECYTSGQIGEAVGSLINVSNFCKLPVGASCDPEQAGDCLTGTCDEASGACACNTVTNFGCSEGQQCVEGSDGSYTCSEPGEVGDGSIGSDCFVDDDCDFQICSFDPPSPDAPGFCTCNPELESGDGCEGDYECYTSGQIGEAVGSLISVSNFCKLPVGAVCDPEQAGDCLTGTCDQETGACACNLLTSFGCDEGKECVEVSDGSFSCLVIGDGSDGSIGSDCLADDDCDSGSCYRDSEAPDDLPGFCVCDTTTNAGCEGEFICSVELGGLDFLIPPDTPPSCYLPIGAACDINDSCLSRNCDETTNLCACNFFDQIGCDTDGGEICTTEDGQSICKVPNNEPIGNNCINNEDCASDTCFYGFQPFGTPGTCACNAETNFGCEGDFVCYTPEEIIEAAFLADAPQGCYLPFGASCDPSEFGCITGNCDTETNTCGCSELSNFPCDTDAGEVCLVGDGTYTCGPPDIALSDSVFACPASTGVCATIFAPVICGGCEYSNQCFATSADPSFTAETCTPVERR